MESVEPRELITNTMTLLAEEVVEYIAEYRKKNGGAEMPGYMLYPKLYSILIRQSEVTTNALKVILADAALRFDELTIEQEMLYK